MAKYHGIFEVGGGGGIIGGKAGDPNGKAGGANEPIAIAGARAGRRELDRPARPVLRSV